MAVRRDAFTTALEWVLDHEGGWTLTCDPDDRGGMTYAGISRAANPDWDGWPLIDARLQGRNVAGRRLRIEDPELTRRTAARYRGRYWSPIEGNALSKISPRLARAVFSSAVLSHPRTTARLLQIAAEVEPDGHVGPVTLAALTQENEKLVLARFALARIARFSRIVARNRKQSKWLRGWVERALEDSS